MFSCECFFLNLVLVWVKRWREKGKNPVSVQKRIRLEKLLHYYGRTCLFPPIACGLPPAPVGIYNITGQYDDESWAEYMEAQVRFWLRRKSFLSFFLFFLQTKKVMVYVITCCLIYSNLLITHAWTCTLPANVAILFTSAWTHLLPPFNGTLLPLKAHYSQ